jgi:AcrR family transcriptional regulator
VTEGPGAPRTTIDRQLIVDTAVALLRSEGLEQLTLRRLAADLGVSATAVYRHLRAKDELLELVVDSIYMMIEPPAPRGHWDSRLATLALSSREVFGRFPGLGPYLLARGPAPPTNGSQRWTDAAIQPLLEAGFEPRVAMLAQQLVHDLCALGLPGNPPGTGNPPESSNPPETAKPPQTANSPGTGDRHGTVDHDPEEQFAFGLRCLVDGLRQLVASGAGQPPDSPDHEARISADLPEPEHKTKSKKKAKKGSGPKHH